MSSTLRLYNLDNTSNENQTIMPFVIHVIQLDKRTGSKDPIEDAKLHKQHLFYA